MEDYRSLYHKSILEVRCLILRARYYKYHRAYWEEDKFPELLFLAEANLGEAGRMLEKITWEETHD